MSERVQSIPGLRAQSLMGLVLALILTAAVIDQANYRQHLTFIAITVIVALTGLTVALARKPSTGRWPLGPAGLLLLILLAWSALAITWSRVPYLTVVDVAALGSVVFSYMAWRIVSAPEASDYRPVLGWGLLIAGISLAGVMIGQFFTGHRPAAFFVNPNSASTLMNTLWPMVAVAWLAGPGALLGMHRAHRALPAVLFLLIFAVGIDGSRAAFLAALVVLAMVLGGASYALLVTRRQLIVIVGIFITALLAASLVNLLEFGTGRMLGERIGSLGSPDEADAVRFLQWAATWELIREAPWLGIGPDVFWLAYAGIRPAGDGSAGLYSHNDYLQFWAERGLPGPRPPAPDRCRCGLRLSVCPLRANGPTGAARAPGDGDGNRGIRGDRWSRCPLAFQLSITDAEHSDSGGGVDRRA